MVFRIKLDNDDCQKSGSNIVKNVKEGLVVLVLATPFLSPPPQHPSQVTRRNRYREGPGDFAVAVFLGGPQPLCE